MHADKYQELEDSGLGIKFLDSKPFIDIFSCFQSNPDKTSGFKMKFYYCWNFPRLI